MKVPTSAFTIKNLCSTVRWQLCSPVRGWRSGDSSRVSWPWPWWWWWWRWWWWWWPPTPSRWRRWRPTAPGSAWWSSTSHGRSRTRSKQYSVVSNYASSEQSQDIYYFVGIGTSIEMCCAGGVLGFWGGVGSMGTVFLLVVLTQRYCCRRRHDKEEAGG